MILAEIKQIVNSEIYLPLRQYLIAKCRELKDIDSLEILSTPTTQAIEVKAQKKAYQKLKEILEEVIIWETEANKSEIQMKKKEDYGL